MRFFVSRAAVIARGSPLCNDIALTIDDGPDALCESWLEALAAARILATFFCIGHKLAANPARAHAILAAGHELQNHTYSHAHALALRSRAHNQLDMARANAVLQSFGVSARYMRPVAGMVSPALVAAAKALNLALVHWTSSARDGGPVVVSPARALARLSRGLVPGGILVAHDRAHQAGPTLLPALSAAAKTRGLRFVTLAQLLRT